MLRTTVFLAALLASAALEVQAPTKDKARPAGQLSLREWLAQPAGFSLALVPQYNNQHSIWGLLEYMRFDGLLNGLKGISACSGGTLPGGFIAAGQGFDRFSQAFPKNGWLGFGPSEPKITEDYNRFLSGGLPQKFEQLRLPFAISATHWEDERALKYFVKSKSSEMVITKGDLYPAMLTAVATGNSGLIPDKKCPRCKTGFWPQTINGHYPVTDGAFTDIWGTRGLTDLPSHNGRLLHILPLDYPGQTDPQPAKDIAMAQGIHPSDLVTLVVTQPPVASHSYFHEAFRQNGLPSATKRSTAEWNQLMFEKAHTGVAGKMNEKMLVESPGHHVVLVDNAKEMRKIETFREKVYDAYMDTMRDNFWKFWGAQEGFDATMPEVHEVAPVVQKVTEAIPKGKMPF